MDDPKHTNLHTSQVIRLVTELVIKNGEDYLFSGAKWTKVAAKLNISRREINILSDELRDGKVEPDVVMYRMLEAWNMQRPNEASVEQLVVIFRQLEFNDIALGVEKNFYEELRKRNQKNTDKTVIQFDNITLPKHLSSCSKTIRCKRFILPVCIMSVLFGLSVFGLVQLVNGKSNQKPNMLIDFAEKSNESKVAESKNLNVKFGIIDCKNISGTTTQLLTNETIVYLAKFAYVEKIQIEDFSLCAVYCDIFVAELRIQNLATVIIKNVPDSSSFNCLKTILEKYSGSLKTIDINAAYTFNDYKFKGGTVFPKAGRFINRASDIYNSSEVLQTDKINFSGETLCEKFPQLKTLYYEYFISGTEFLYTLTSCSLLTNLTILVEIGDEDIHFDINLILNNRIFDYINLSFRFVNECPHLEWYKSLEEFQNRCAETKFTYINCPSPDSDSSRKEKFVFHHKYGILEDMP